MMIARQGNKTLWTRRVSILENGHVIDGKYPVGYSIMTQWGERKVVSTKVETLDITQTEPEGV